MQTSEHLIAYQTVSLAAYQRLRETLIQQEHVFKWVMTEATDSRLSHVQAAVQHIHHSSSSFVNNPSVNSHTVNSHTSHTVNSHTVNSHTVSSRNSHRIPSHLTDAHLNGHLTGAHLTESHLSARHSARHLDKAQSFRASCSGSCNGSGVEGFVLMCSPTLNVLLTATPIEPQMPRMSADRGSYVTADQRSREHPEHCEYRVGLTFDDRAIAVFLDRLKISSIRSIQGETYPMSAQNDHPPFDRKTEVSKDDKMVAQKAFVLSWAKNLAASPGGEQQSTQATLKSQAEQSLLLDQVITRIRHSLDLPAILETTVAQVREFLSADRLVLYQFHHSKVDHSKVDHSKVDHSKVSDESLLTAMPVDDVLASRLTSSPGGLSARSHSGHVTYESLASSSISSVLHYSETECFEASLAMRARYLMGKPIAVNNIDEQYAHIHCLLDFLRQANIKSKIIAPIIVQDQLWGLLIAHQCDDYRQWKETEAIFLQHIAEHLAVAITQASLYQQLRQQTVSLESCVIERTQSLHDALMAAESANITKSEFLSTMSHELRTPLTYIIGMSATLLRWSFGELNDRQRSYLTTINQSGEQLLDVINNILEFASVESGRSILDFSELSLAELMNSIVAHHQPLADKKKVTLTLALNTGDEDLFKADAKRLQQIISNLVHNAIKFTDAGGHVAVRVWREPRTAIFQIEDTGIGIPESQQDSLFEQFKQLEPPFQRQYSGTGLGLAMTKRLVELHGGSIQIDSQVSKGSTFTVRLPVQSESMPPHYQIPQLDEGKKRIILLETQEDNAAIACEMLTAAGYEVIWLIESEQLATQLNLLRPVMLIADLALIDPNISNIKAIQLAITALNAKVLALTHESDSASASMAHHDVLQKPIDPKALLSKVRKLMLALA